MDENKRSDRGEQNVINMSRMMTGLSQFVPDAILSLYDGGGAQWDTFTQDYQNAMLNSAKRTFGQDIKVADEEWMDFPFNLSIPGFDKVRAFAIDRQGHITLKLERDIVNTLVNNNEQKLIMYLTQKRRSCPATVMVGADLGSVRRMRKASRPR